MKPRMHVLHLFGIVAFLAAILMVVILLPPQQVSAAQLINVKQSTLTDFKCDPSSPDEWHFVINQIKTESNAPSSITVSWSDGTSSTVPRQKFTGGVAHYSAPVVPGVYPTDAQASIYDAWKGQFNLSHGPCVVLDVSKTANTAYDRTFSWSIEKAAEHESLEIPIGQQSVTTSYSVAVSVEGYTDGNWVVSGTITISNPGPVAATITSVNDNLAAPECGVSFPYVLGIGEVLTCTYSASLDGPEAGTNTATVLVTQAGAGPFSANADYVFSDPTNLIDECVDVVDTYAGPLGGVCLQDAPKTFTYGRTFGRADLNFECDVEHSFDNTATFTTNDTGATGSDSASVIVVARCPQQGAGDEGCTPGYWKNHPGAWVGYSTDQTVGSVFNGADASLNSATLQEALEFGGGSGIVGAQKILLRAAVAALLNAANPNVDYPLATSEVIRQVNEALASNDRDTMLALASQLDGYNNLGCPLN